MKPGIFGYAAESQRNQATLRRTNAEHEDWAEAILPADTAAGTVQAELNRRPAIILSLVMALGLGILGLRLFQLQIVGGAHNLVLANGNRIRSTVMRAPRGVVYDRNHQVLVNNQANFDLVVTPQLLPRAAAERQALYVKVGALVGLTPAQIAGIADSKTAPPTQANLVVAGLERTKALLLDQAAASLPGFALDINPIRRYEDGGLLSVLLGYTGRVAPGDLAAANSSYGPTDYIGKSGLEQQYEEVLRGANGSEQTEVDAQGRPIRVLASQPATPGHSLVLSIDQPLQAHFAAALQAQLVAAKAQRASGIALDPTTGEILAAVSLPSYDNNLFASGISPDAYAKLLADPGQPLFNKAINGNYPTGSTIKPFVASAVLDEHVVTPDTTIVDAGKLVVTNPYNPSITYTYNGWEHSGLGVMNVTRALAMSSDIYFYTVAGGFGSFKGLGIEKLASYYQKFGLGSKTGVDLPGEAAGRVPTPAWKEATLHQPWYTGDTYNVSVGQGDILVSPLQLAVATAAVANGGTLLQPHLVKQVLDDGGAVVRTVGTTAVRTNLISPANLAVVRGGMRQAVVSGTACCLIEQQVPVAVAAKTGTAETDPDGGRPPEAWFTAFAPYDHPKIVIVALVENSGEGAVYAAPAVRQTLAWYFGPH